MSDTATWRHEGDRARLTCGPFQAELAAPGDGLRALSWEGRSLDGALFALTTPSGPLPPAEESYARGDDLVTTHAPSDAFPFRTQLYWSARPLTGGGVAATLTVSLQTDLLDAQPGLTLTSVFGAGASLDPPAPGAVRLAAQGGVACVVTPHPSDAAECVARAVGDQAELAFSPPFLEKGVIRRCRLAALLAPGDDRALDAALTEFAAEPLPLTT